MKGQEEKRSVDEYIARARTQTTRNKISPGQKRKTQDANPKHPLAYAHTYSKKSN